MRGVVCSVVGVVLVVVCAEDYAASCFSLAGGTDIISCFAGQNPTLPVHRGEIQARNLGMAMECWNEDGE